MKIKLIILMIIAITATLSGCIHDEVKLKASMQAVHYLNPDIKGIPSPLVINIYQLKSTKLFKNISYKQLIDNPADHLGTTLIEQSKIEIRPGQHKYINEYLNFDTNFVGIVAGYRNIDKANWRSILQVAERTKKIKVRVSLESQGMYIKKMDNNHVK